MNVSDVVHSRRSLCKLLSSYRERETYSEHCSTFKMECFAKRIVPEYRCATRSFPGREVFVELWHFDKHFIKNTSKKLHNYTTTFLNQNNSTQRWTQLGSFFSKINAFFFQFSKKSRGGLPASPLLARMWVWINMYQYPQISLKCLHNVLTMSGLQICLVILHVRQAFEDASGSKCVWVLNMTRLYM